MLAGGGVFGQDFVAFFDFFDGFVALIGVDQGLGGEDVAYKNRGWLG